MNEKEFIHKCVKKFHWTEKHAREIYWIVHGDEVARKKRPKAKGGR